MLPWFLKLIGVGSDFLDNIENVSLSMQHTALFWAGMVLLVPVSIYIFLRQKQNFPTTAPWIRVALTLTRILVLFMLVVVLGGPYLKLDYDREKKPIVAVLIDQSQSMQLESGPFDVDNDLVRLARAAGYQVVDDRLDTDTRKAINKITRADLARTVLQNGGKSVLEKLGKRFEVRFYAFDRELTPLPVDPDKMDIPAPKEWGKVTQIGNAVAEAVKQASGRPIAAIIPITDGENTGGLELHQAAQMAQAAGAPIFPVPVGVNKRLADISIVDVFTSGQVAVGDTVRVAVTIESQGFDHRTVPVELRDGDGKVLDTKECVLRDSEQQQVELTYTPSKAGAQYLTVTIAPQPEEPESLRANNTDTAFVRVTDEKLRVLFIDGMPRWDYRFLKNAMRRDHGLGGLGGTPAQPKEPDIVLEAEWRRHSPEEQARALPRTLKDLAEYHTIVIGDVSPQLLTPAFQKLLIEAVRERGVGLIVAAGPQAMPHLYDTAFQELLPARMIPRRAGLEAVARPFRLELTPEGSIHESMRFYDDPGRNQNAWSHMAPCYWLAAVKQAAPGATTLVAVPNKDSPDGKLPVVLDHYAGAGRVMFVGTDSTYLWRQIVGDRFFYKFWGQAIRFVARRDASSAQKSWIEVRPLRAQPGEQATIELHAVHPNGTPYTEPVLPVRVVGGGMADTVNVALDPVIKGQYSGKFLLKASGDYRVTWEPTGEELVEARIRVLEAPEEMRHPSVDRNSLKELAAVGASGGSVTELYELDTLLDRLKGDVRMAHQHREATLWDNWLLLAILIIVYSLDVGLRRLAGLS